MGKGMERCREVGYEIIKISVRYGNSHLEALLSGCSCRPLFLRLSSNSLAISKLANRLNYGGKY